MDDNSGRIERDFRAFHEANPRVYSTLVKLAREARANGHRVGGIGMLWEVMRWEMWLTTSDSGSEFKLNNNYRSRYARMLMEREPDLAGFFRIRDLRA